MWSDGGDSVEYTEDEYVWFCKRRGYELTEEQFKSLVQDSKNHWVDINVAIRGVKYLIELFKTLDLQPLDGCYDLQYTRPDFESLYEILEIFAKQRYGVVRLNFS